MRFNKPVCLLLATFALYTTSIAQTKLIAFKSHSGSNENFRLAYESNFFDMENSNLGVLIERDVTTASLDTLILISDTVAVMVTSVHITKYGRKKPNTGNKWRPGRDTVYHHPLFSKKNSIRYIKNYLHQYYYFQNPTDSIKFIIHETEVQQQQQEEQSLPAIGFAGGNDNNGNGDHPVMWLSLMAVFSLLAGLAYYFLSSIRKARLC